MSTYMYGKELENFKTKVNGAKVLSVEAEDGRVDILTDRGTLRIDAYGDCCSSSYFLNHDECQSLVGETLTTLEERPESPRESVEDADYSGSLSQFYGLDINYVRGSVFLEMRNDSNGYYGGSFDLSFT